MLRALEKKQSTEFSNDHVTANALNIYFKMTSV